MYKKKWEGLPLQIVWEETYDGQGNDYVLHGYQLEQGSHLKYGPFKNIINPYVLSPADERLLDELSALEETGKGRRINSESRPLADGEGTQIRTIGYLERTGFAFELVVQLHADRIDARLSSPFLTGFSPEDGRSIYLSRPKLRLIYPNTVEELRLYGGGQFSGVVELLGKTDGDFYFTAPFEIEAALPSGRPDAIEFFAEDVVNWRWRTSDGKIEVPVYSASQ